MQQQRIMIVDDERNMQSVLELLFQQSGYRTVTADSAEQAVSLLDRQPGVDMIISDLKMQGMDGIGLLRHLRSRRLDIPFVLITAFGTIERAVEVMKLGAVDVLTKPFAKDAILDVVSRCLAQTGTAKKTRDEDARNVTASLPVAGASFGGLRLTSASMAKVVELIAKIGPVRMPVLLNGESGTGKEVAARALHTAYAGSFERLPFVSVNCPAMPEHLLESELFGYRRGAFTGANQDFRGKIEQADGGTLFLDEIGDLPLSLQPKLLRLLENRTYEPLGSGNVRSADLRIVCATNRDLKKLVDEGRFREDLYYRINTFTIELPALRERREDIAVLAAHFLRECAVGIGKNFEGFSDDVLEALRAYPWPGNIRELKNVVQHAAVLGTGRRIVMGDLPDSVRTSGGGATGIAELPLSGVGITRTPAGGTDALAANERLIILDALRSTDGNVCAAARNLGISRNTLRYRIHKHGIVDRG